MLLMANMTFPSTASSPDAPDRLDRTPQHEALRVPKPRRKRRKAWARRSVPGAPPGTLLPDPEAPLPVIHVISYGPDAFTEQTVESPALVRAFLQAWPLTWVNVEGLGDATVIRQLGDLFGLHRLALEDVINVHQRAKVEQYGEHHFIVTRMVRLGERLETEQVSLFLGRHFVLTFQEGLPGDCLEPVRDRLRQGHGRIREAGADYLAYALLDAVIDSYFPVLEAYGERLETLEEELITRPVPGLIPPIHDIKRDLLVLRRALWPQREALNILLRDELPLITHETRLHLRDCYDHTVQLIDLMETYRELSSDLMEMYLSSVSNRTSEIMRVLTIIATIFIPLTFIAGIYGMNFDPDVSPWNMPELKWYWGYPFALAVMALIAISQLFFFRRRGWLGPLAFIQQQPMGPADQPASESRAPIRERDGSK